MGGIAIKSNKKMTAGQRIGCAAPSPLQVGRVSSDLGSLTRVQKRRLIMMADAIVIASSIWLSLVLMLGELWPEERLMGGWWLFVTLLLLGVKIFEWRGVYRDLLRSMDRNGYLKIAYGVILLSLVMAALTLLSVNSPVPGATPVMFCFVAFAWASLLRVLAQSYYHWLRHGSGKKKPVVVYGAGDAGTRLAAALKQSSEYQPVAFIDDDSTLYQSTIHGCPVLRPSGLGEVISRQGVSKVFLAVPSAAIRRGKEILHSLSKHKVDVRTMPSISELVGGFAWVNQLRTLMPTICCSARSLTADCARPGERLREERLIDAASSAPVCTKILNDFIGPGLCAPSFAARLR